jgi:Zn-dependent peptidase ImmA (M78 family)
MAKRVEALATPELLVWARKSAGFSVEQTARKAAIKPAQLVSWESGEQRPTVNQLRKLSEIYKRPIAVFYLSVPPKDFAALRDYRSIFGTERGLESPRLKLEIRRAWSRREIALELYTALEGRPPDFSLSASVWEDPEKLAKRLRSLLKVSREIQSQFGDDYVALRWWRSALESQGLMVFQAGGVEISEMRGFSISARPLPVIVVNIKDAVLARIFTILHEFVHVLLHKGGLCDLAEHGPHAADREIEIFSNRVAGEILVPREDLIQESILIDRGPNDWWPDEEIAELARTYRVSREVILRRMLICGLTTKEFYEQKRSEWQPRKAPLSSGGPAPHTRAISTVGNTFIRLVLANYYQENITSSDVSDFLGVKLKHVKRIEQEIIGHSVEFGAVA